MKRVCLIVLSLLAAAPAPPAGAQSIKSKELLGVRLGGVISIDELDDCFGKGSELEIHFIEGLGTWYGIGVSLSMHNFGRSLDPEKNFEFLNADRVIKLEIYSVTVEFVARRALGGKFSLCAEAGGGLYTINAVIPSGVWEGTITKNRLGVNAGAGILYRLTRDGLALEASVKYHHVFTGTNEDLVIYAFTGNSKADYFQVTAGVILFTW